MPSAIKPAAAFDRLAARPARYWDKRPRQPSRAYDYSQAGLTVRERHTRHQLVLQWTGAASNLAKRYVLRGMQFGLGYEQLYSAARAGLVIASRRFDFNKGTKFTTYAYWWMRCYIKKDIQEQRWFGLNGKGESSYNEPLKRVAAQVKTLDDGSDYDLLAIWTSTPPEESSLETEEWWDRILKLIPGGAKGRYGKLLVMYYRQGKGLREIGEKIDVSHERVRQLIEKGIGYLRRALARGQLHPESVSLEKRAPVRLSV